MKAIILNSGLGKRMGEYTKNNHKSMVVLSNGETIYERQIRILRSKGIKDIIVTVGPFKEQLIEASKKFPDVNFKFIYNPVYDKTNYIYSIYLASSLIDDDFLLMHGDLVFNEELVEKMINDERKSLCLINENKKLPEKDFKGRIIDGKLKEVSINIFDSNCYAFQPLYKLDKETIAKWKEKIIDFVESGNTGVYAEEALNKIADKLNIYAYTYKDDYIDEIDNSEDYERVKKEITEYENSKKNNKLNSEEEVNELLKKKNIKNIFIVVSKSQINCSLIKTLNNNGYNLILFSDYSPNPLYEEVTNGIKKFKENKCDFIISIGGGSAIDVAKCIKAFLTMDEEKNYLEQVIKKNSINHLAIPTTAGTGSESTQFAVIYNKNVKKSVDNEMLLPDYIMLDYKYLKSLPSYQKKSTMLDALCQAIESFWSINATEESRIYASKAIKVILDNYEKYINENEEVYDLILEASNNSGKAINISRTTAPHAMSYKLTSLYGISHGHAVAMCMPYVWNYMIEHVNPILNETFNKIDQIFGTNSHKESLQKFIELYEKLNMPKLKDYKEEEIEILTNSVNAERLKNNPIELEKDEISKIYRKVLK